MNRKSIILASFTVVLAANPIMVEAAGFPVKAAFTALIKKGYHWTFELESPSGIKNSYEESQEPMVMTKAGGGVVRTATSESLSAISVGAFAVVANAHTSQAVGTYDADFNLVSILSSDHLYCEGDGVPSVPDFLAKRESGRTATYRCYQDADTARVKLLATIKTDYAATIAGDGTLQYRARGRLFDAGGKDTGAFSATTYKITKGGNIVPFYFEEQKPSDGHLIHYAGSATRY